MTEETPPAVKADKPSKAAKRKKPTEKRATKKTKSEQVSGNEHLSDALNTEQSEHLPLFVFNAKCYHRPV